MVQNATASFATADEALQAAQAARAAGRPLEELASAELATRLAPERNDAWIALAGAAARANRPDIADRAQQRGLETTSDPVQKARLSVDRAWTLVNLGRWAEAAQIVRKPWPELAEDPIARVIQAASLATLGYAAEAAPHLEYATSQMPQRADFWYNLAVAYRALGRLDEARVALDRTVREAPGFLQAYELIGLLKKAMPQDNFVPELQAIRRRLQPTPEAARIDYAMFKQLDDLGRTVEAWGVLARATQVMQGVSRYSAAEDAATAEAMKGAFPAKARGAGGEGVRNVFIVGLPRTGTTLIERIIGAHPRAKALGELEAFGRAVKAAADVPFHPYVDVRVARGADRIDWAAVGAEYRSEAGALADGAELVTDKMPLNWWYAGAIAAALPDAKILHVRREPMDALFGAFKMPFAPAFDWSYRFEDMAAHYKVYRDLTDHWRATLGDAFVEVDYEDVVRAPDTGVPALLEKLGLSFDEACLAPEKAKVSVMTPSASQVREPISIEKVGAWRTYEKELEPLRALLEQGGWVDAKGDGVRA